MPAKEIKELRQSGKLTEALALASAELAAAPENIWAKRNISWVYYEFLKANNSVAGYNIFLDQLNLIKNLDLPAEEVMLFDQICWQVGKLGFALLKEVPVHTERFRLLFQSIKTFHFTIPSEGYSFLFKALHKGLKDTDDYLDFADWWSFENFRPEDFEKEIMPNGNEIMALAEQAYIAYSKRLLLGELLHADGWPENARYIEVEKIADFMLRLDVIIEKYPSYQYPPYFKAKLLLASGDREHMLTALLPFAKKKRNDFWVWDVMAEALSDDPEKVFACYCKALSCKSPEEMLVSLRKRMSGIFIHKQLYNEAKTEIELLVKARIASGFKIPNDILGLQSQEWYRTAVAKPSNLDFYKKYFQQAEDILFADSPEETVIVEFVNTDKKMLNFIASESKFGFFKYERLLNKVNVGDILKVRFQSGSKEGLHKVYTVYPGVDDAFKREYLKLVEGAVKIPEGKNFGIVNNIFIHPSIISKHGLSNDSNIKGHALKSYNSKKGEWGYKLIRLL